MTESLAFPQTISKHASLTDAANLCFPPLAASRGLVSGHRPPPEEPEQLGTYLENGAFLRCLADLTALIDFGTTSGHPLPNFELQAGAKNLFRLSRPDHDASKMRNWLADAKDWLIHGHERFRKRRESGRRMIKRLVGFAVLVLTGLGSNGCASLRNNGLNPAETMMLSTYPLASDEAFGTGFLMAMKNRGAKGGVVPVMVTSTHLVKTAGLGAIYMPLRGFDAEGNLTVTILEVVPAKNGMPFYVRHPRLDVAAFRVRFPRNFPTPLLLTLLEERNLESEKEPRAGEEVTFVGFPEGQGTSLGMFPVLRAGKVASFDQSLLGLRSFLINGDVYPGDSGAPVFRASRSGRPGVVGMVIERLGFERRNPFPLALAVDARAIRETLRLLSERDQ